jgi:hypothetical protein
MQLLKPNSHLGPTAVESIHLFASAGPPVWLSAAASESSWQEVVDEGVGGC